MNFDDAVAQKAAWRKPELSYDGDVRDYVRQGNKISPSTLDPGEPAGKPPGQK